MHCPYFCLPHIFPVYVIKRENAIVNRLNKTKVIREVDHENEKIERTKAESSVRRAAAAEKVGPSCLTKIQV